MEGASPQLEDGYTRIANELLDAIIAFSFSARQMRVFMALIRKLYGFNKKRDDISASQIAEMCAMHRSHVSETLGQLALMRVIFKEPGRFGTMIEINKRYDQWLELDSKGTPQPRATRARIEHAFHYTYRTTRIATGEFYLGVRSCACHPNQDRYVGSGNWISTVKAVELKKEVLAIFGNRDEAEQAEKDLIRANSDDPLIRNTTLYRSTDLVQGGTDSVQVGQPENEAFELTPASTDSVQGVQKTDAGDTDSVQVDSTDSVHTKDNLPKEIKQKTKTFPRSLRERFEIFWAAYPRKTEKQDALKAFTKLNPDDDLLEQILVALEVAKKSEQWKVKRFIKHATTWLNKACWQDELTVEYTPKQIEVIEAFNAQLGELLGRVDVAVFVETRASAIDDFLTFSRKDPDFWKRYFPWVHENVDVPPRCGFDWLISRDGFTKVKGGQFTRTAA
ncbi:replication protein [Paraburkholderia sacchari]|uniref:replication protein n=1 Tax=Paraburkholderia sacchari TaxID=159450 RepID=UPI001BD001ED|nr:replication protein [Paraburkholderia sacchari]